MISIILLFGALTLLAGIVIIVNPEAIFDALKKHADKLLLHLLAVMVRLALGALLIYHSEASRFPLAIEIIGWLSIVAAGSFAVIGRSAFRRLMSWALSLAKPYGRLGGLLAICFGAFLIYAFI